MRIVVLVKPVPDPASAGERLGPDGRLDRAAVPAVVNGNDEYVLEAALKLIEAAGEGEITLLSMAPTNAPETLRKALAMGATRAVHVTDPALAGSDHVSTAKVLAAALGTLEYDMVFAGIDSSDGVGGVVPAAIAAHLGLPYLSYAAKIEPDMGAGTVRVRRISATGYDVLEAPLPVVIGGTQALGEPRYPSLKGIMAARNKEIVTKSLGDLGVDDVGTRRRGRDHRRPRQPAATGPGGHGGRSRDTGRGSRPDRRLPRRAEAHLMGALWVVAEPGPEGGLAKISAEAATLARDLGAASGRDVIGIVIAADPAPAAKELATYLPVVWAITEPAAAEHAWSAVAAGHIAALAGEGEPPDVIFVGAGADGRDLAGAVSALTGLGVLVNAIAVSWTDAGPIGRDERLRWQAADDVGLHRRPRDHHGPPECHDRRLRPRPPARSKPRDSTAKATLPAVRVVERVSEAGAQAPIEEAKIIVAGGRGVGGRMASGSSSSSRRSSSGAVGATRAAVDSGWIPYSQQIGQTGKIVKPDLYLALGISGAIQHKVGMRTSGAIVAVNRDADAPIAEFADLFVVGDLFEVGNALLEQLRARSG